MENILICGLPIKQNGSITLETAIVMPILIMILLSFSLVFIKQFSAQAEAVNAVAGTLGSEIDPCEVIKYTDIGAEFIMKVVER